MAEQLDITVTGEAKAELPEIPMSPELQRAMQTDPMLETVGMDLTPQIVTPVQIERFLKEAYHVHGLLTYKDIWIQTDDWFGEVAEAITPDINRLCVRLPALGHTIKAVDAAGGWGRLGWDYTLRWYMTWQRKQEDNAKKQGAQPNEQPANHVPQPGRAAGPVVDYRPTEQPVRVVQYEQPTAPVQPHASGDIYRVDYRPGMP